MVGSVIMPRGENLAKSVVELTSIMTPSARITSAGGMDGDGFGTSFGRIQAAIGSVYSDDGALVLVDLGSAIMTTEMVIEIFEEKKVEMVDCPLVEGTVVATIGSVDGVSFEDTRTAPAGVGRAKRF